MVRKKKPDKQITRTLSIWNHFSHNQQNILRFMIHESKNIYNASIFHTQIYNRYHNEIFHQLYRLVKSKEITSPKQFDNKLYKLYDNYYKHYLLIKSFLKHNNNFIYKFIRDLNIIVVNDNFEYYFNKITTLLCKNRKLDYPVNSNESIKKELCDDIIHNILRSMYNRNFRLTESQILSHKECTIKDVDFIAQVQLNKHLFNRTKQTKYKALVKKHKVFLNRPSGKSIKSDQNYIARIVYKYYTKPKIPSDLMCNIIKKAYQAYSSYYSLRKKGIKANIPKFLKSNGTYILPFYPRSRKEVTIHNKKYYRLTVGSTVADNLIHIMDDNRYTCINDQKANKLYVMRDDLIEIPQDIKISKKDNYVIGNKYIPKKSPKIIESYYLYITKPPVLDNKNHKLKLIEIVPIYDGHYFKVSYIYSKKKTNNKPVNGKCISADLGMVNLITIHDPNGEQGIIKGGGIIGMNKFYNKKIDELKSIQSKQKENVEKNSTNTLFSRLQMEFRYHLAIYMLFP